MPRSASERALAIADDLDLTRSVPPAEHPGRRARPPWRPAGLARPGVERRDRGGAQRCRSHDPRLQEPGERAGELGELGRATEFERGVEAAHRFGRTTRSSGSSELAILAYLAGDWDSADEAFARLDTWVAEVGPHYMESAARSVRAQMRAARGDPAGAHDTWSRGSTSHDAPTPQLLLSSARRLGPHGGEPGGQRCRAAGAPPLRGAPPQRADGAEGGYWTAAAAPALVLTDQPELFAGIASTDNRAGSSPRGFSSPGSSGGGRRPAREDRRSAHGGVRKAAGRPVIDQQGPSGRGRSRVAESDGLLEQRPSHWHCATAEALLARTA